MTFLQMILKSVTCDALFLTEYTYYEDLSLALLSEILRTYGRSVDLFFSLHFTHVVETVDLRNLNSTSLQRH